jgi:hypothetical protein
LVEQLYQWTVTRAPTAKESELATQFLRQDPAKRTEAAEDLMWALLNSRDFLLVH